MDEKTAFIRLVAEMLQDGECESHGPDCDGSEPDECDYFVMENDDAVSTLDELIERARQILDRAP